MSGRKCEKKYADSHDNNGVARHKVSAKNIDHYATRNNDHMDNYRMGTREQNSVDSRIDNMIEKGEFYSDGLSGGSYIKPERVRDRITQQVDSYKQMDQYSKRDMQKLYVAAEEYDMDLRIFNGAEFKRPN
eukprot:TRINITY_DN17778_c0_g1_i1.p1 TRINITY_DN17778_c0_g1~~TRINITY_DN17778_c0_g1_i1.p1  ORF type:complete len:131 (-),score=9.69 TRINITY_DN17778_c0_g1_i1:13-405(-)